MPNVYNYNINSNGGSGGGGGGMDPRLMALLAQQGYSRPEEEEEKKPTWKKVLPYAAAGGGGLLLWYLLNRAKAAPKQTTSKPGIDTEAIKRETTRQMNTPAIYTTEGQGDGTRPAYNKSSIPFRYAWNDPSVQAAQAAELPPAVSFDMNKLLDGYHDTPAPTQGDAVAEGIKSYTANNLGNPRIRGEMRDNARHAVYDNLVNGSRPLIEQSREQWGASQEAIRQSARDELANKDTEFWAKRYPSTNPITAAKNKITDNVISPLTYGARNWWSDAKNAWK